MTDFYGTPTYKMKPVSQLVNETYALNNPEMEDLFKADAPVLMATTGVRNNIYGAKLFYQLSTESNVFGVLPKVDWEKSGFRFLTASANSTGGGVAENSAIPDTTKPTFADIDISPAEMATSFNMSLKALNIETKDDTIRWAQVVDYMGLDHKKLINVNLCTDVDTLAGNNIESIDRVCSSNSEASGLSLTAGDNTFQGLDRDSGDTYADAYVNHNSGTDRALTIKLIRDTITEIEPYWDRPQNKVIITGYDTASDIASLYETQQRYIDYVNLETNFNGIRVVGRETGFRCATFDGIPIIRSNNIAKDVASRIYILDLDHIGIAVAKPTTLWSSDNYLELGAFAREGVFYTSAQLFATKFKCHGKIRDLL